MPDLTSKLGLKKPLGNETFNRQSYNENLDLIDQNVETPADSQAKADAAEIAAKAYTDQEVGTVRDDVSAHLADLMPHELLDYSAELTRIDGVLTSVIKKIGGVKRVETTLIRTDGKLTSVNVKKYDTDGITVLEEYTDTLTRTDGKLTSVARAVV